jgi:enolase
MLSLSPHFLSLQKVNVVEQEKIDKLMIEMDGTENKCELHGWSP